MAANDTTNRPAGRRSPEPAGRRSMRAQERLAQGHACVPWERRCDDRYVALVRGTV